MNYNLTTTWNKKEYINTNDTLHITYKNRALLALYMESIFGVDNYYICEIGTNFYKVERFRESQED